MEKTDTRAHELDLPLLRRFEALVAAQSVSGAAAATGITQPGMSIALAKLRRALADPVLVRVHGRMVATDRARALLPEVREILQRVHALARPDVPFEPATARATFSLALMDSVANLLLPRLVRKLADDAPHARLECRASNHELIQGWFDAGEVHLGIGYHPRPPGHLHARVIFTDSWALLASAVPPQTRGRASAERLLRMPLLKVSAAASDLYWDVIANGIAAAGGTPCVGPTVPSFLAAAHVVAESTLVAAMPMRLARAFAAELPVRAQPLPLTLPPLTFGMRWHSRTHASPEHRWFRSLAFACARTAMEVPRDRR